MPTWRVAETNVDHMQVIDSMVLPARKKRTAELLP